VGNVEFMNNFFDIYGKALFPEKYVSFTSSLTFFFLFHVVPQSILLNPQFFSYIEAGSTIVRVYHDSPAIGTDEYAGKNLSLSLYYL
jgi:hypothetical protein